LYNYSISNHLAYTVPYDTLLSNGIKVARGWVEYVLVAHDTAICHSPPLHTFTGDI